MSLLQANNSENVGNKTQKQQTIDMMAKKLAFTAMEESEFEENKIIRAAKTRVGYGGRRDRLKPTSNFVGRCNFCPGDPNQIGPTLDSERKPTSKYVLYPTLKTLALDTVMETELELEENEIDNALKNLAFKTIEESKAKNQVENIQEVSKDHGEKLNADLKEINRKAKELASSIIMETEFEENDIDHAAKKLAFTAIVESEAETNGLNQDSLKSKVNENVANELSKRILYSTTIAESMAENNGIETTARKLVSLEDLKQLKSETNVEVNQLDKDKETKINHVAKKLVYVSTHDAEKEENDILKIAMQLVSDSLAKGLQKFKLELIASEAQQKNLVVAEEIVSVTKLPLDDKVDQKKQQKQKKQQIPKWRRFKNLFTTCWRSNSIADIDLH